MALFVLVCCRGAEAQAEPAGADLPSNVTADGRGWSWRETLAPDTALRLDFVRADIVIEPAAGGAVEVVATARHDPAASHARLVLAREGADVRILDVFPGLSPVDPWTECLPPLDEHGDIWNHVVRFTVTVRAPAGQPVRATVRDGVVRDLRPASSAVTGMSAATEPGAY